MWAGWIGAPLSQVTYKVGWFAHPTFEGTVLPGFYKLVDWAEAGIRSRGGNVELESEVFQVEQQPDGELPKIIAHWPINAPLNTE